MGGKALKTFETKRLDAREYHALVPKVLNQIASVVGHDRPMCEVQAYRSKPNFGDMDVLVVSDNIPTDYKDEIARAFQSREVVRNGNVTSFDCDGFQVDVIAISAASFEFARAYFAWNDLGNLIGRVAHKMGLKFAFEGLYAPLRDGDHMFAEVLVTRDVDRALSTLGYDADRYRQGFESLEDIFRFTASSPYFNPDIYLLENRNATSRVRDAKRRTYSAFLDWLAAPTGLAAYKAEPAPGGWFSFPADKTFWLNPLRHDFPEFNDRLSAALVKKTRHEKAKAFFNGALVSEQTGLTGKELGEVMRAVRARHANQDALVEWVLAEGLYGVRQAVEQVASERTLSTSVPVPRV